MTPKQIIRAAQKAIISETEAHAMLADLNYSVITLGCTTYLMSHKNRVVGACHSEAGAASSVGEARDWWNIDKGGPC